MTDKNPQHTIIELKPDNTHLIKIPDKMYKQLQEIGKTNPYDADVSMTAVIGFLIRWYEVSVNYYSVIQEIRGKQLFHDLIFGKDEQE